jgi:hypothetical protein
LLGILSLQKPESFPFFIPPSLILYSLFAMLDPLDSLALNFSNMADWIKFIISPGRFLGIITKNFDIFQIFATVACDLLWFYRNKAYHDGVTHEALAISRHINKVTLEHHAAWKSKLSIFVEKWAPPLEGIFKIN